MTENTDSQKVIVKDYSKLHYEDADDQDFFVKTLKDERLIDFLPERDFPEIFELDMRNIGSDEDLPDSDRITACQTRGITKEDCFE